MEQAPEAFQRSVAAVAESMDDGDIRIEELAQRTCLSRFHLDHVVRSIAGETPAHFRRRVLLERAAFRLRKSRASVLDIAIVAGYTSNEAFITRHRERCGSRHQRGCMK